MIFLLLVILPFSTVSCSRKPQRMEGLFYFPCAKSEVPASSPQYSVASLPSGTWPAAWLQALRPFLLAGHRFKTAQCLLNHSSSSGLILAVFTVLKLTMAAILHSTTPF